ncbi:cyclic nucleotide-binding/CBS domain-containing protein [Conexibacter sp. CPCC 206217]|uniref:CBS domain-containing protein n=1 Tax=Conexibacter sp. CPCC 206217 TaxID=3064574 RepID=UPI00271BBA45|nr:CBS domain-containing protein [Conexibacter sp. CPCC 206217]MDO8210760.1 CBS domain-containing protein [Conexibacter sp. CPCC 206217]
MRKTAREFVTGIGECVSEYETVLEGARKLAAFGVDALPVCGEDRSVVGVLSERDVVRIVAERRDPDSIRIGLLAHRVWVVDANASVADAFTTMVEDDLDSAPVTDEGRLIGMLRRTDLRAQVDAWAATGTVPAVATV